MNQDQAVIFASALTAAKIIKGELDDEDFENVKETFDDLFEKTLNRYMPKE